MILTKAEYLASIEVLLPDNSTQEISPQDLRTGLTDLVDSVHNFLDNKEISTYNFSTPDVRTTRGGELAIGRLGQVGRSSIDNSAFGYYALGGNYNGNYNTAIGSHSLGCNIYGSENSSLGYNALAGNVQGSGNVGVGTFALQSNKMGNYNIAIGHGAGFYINDNSSFKFYLGVHPEAISGCDVVIESGLPGLLYGDLLNRKLGIGVKNLHNYGSLQVSGSVSPSESGVFCLGHGLYPWACINEEIYFSGESIGIGTSAPSGDGKLTVKGNIVPHTSYIHSLGTQDLRWDGWFNDVNISGVANIHNLIYNSYEECLYECKTLHLATSGLCEPGPGVCGYLSDQSLDGAGFEAHSSGTDYKRSYRWIYKFPDQSLSCLEIDDNYSRSRWQSNISIEIESGKHLQTDRILGDSKLSLVTQSGCYGLFIRDSEASGNLVYLSSQEHLDAGYSYEEDINLIGSSGEVNFYTSFGTIDSGVIVGNKFASRIASNMLGFGIEYYDENDVIDSGSCQQKDRLSIRTYDADSDILEPITVLRAHHGSGLVGVTNKPYSSGSAPVLPQTIFNVQSSGDCAVRFSSEGLANHTSLELVGNSNTRASGFEIRYTPLLDDGAWGDDYYGFCPVGNNSVVDFMLIKPSGKLGTELGAIVIAENTYVGIGRTYQDNTRYLTPNAPLTICHRAADSGTISIKEQADLPCSISPDFGKIYVKPKPVGATQTQSFYFMDDAGNEFDLIGNSDDITGGNVYTDGQGNTFGGIAPSARPLNAGAFNNTGFGFNTQYDITVGDCNTSLGSNALKVLTTGNGNVAIGCGAGAGVTSTSYSILIGSGVLENAAVANYTIAIGNGLQPLILGSMGPTDDLRNFLVNNGRLTITSNIANDHEFGIDHKVEDFRTVTVLEVKDNLNNSRVDGLASLRFTDSDGDSRVLFDFDHASNPMTNVPNYTVADPARPFAELNGDLNLRGAIRFADGTSVDSAGEITILSGTGTRLDNGAIHLDFDDLVDSSYISQSLDTQESYLSISIPSGGIENIITKISLQSLSDYVMGGGASVAANCNMVFTNNESNIDKVNNSHSVFIGCDVGVGATGWKHSVLIGTEAGYTATTPNGGLATDTATIFLGYRAGYDADNVENSIFIGTNAGKNSDTSADSVYIGSSAGLNSKYSNSVGIGEYALAGSGTGQTGSNNIEIVAGLLDNQRLLYDSNNFSNKININNVIAGDSSSNKISIGAATISPDSPLSVIHDGANIPSHASSNYIQTWYCSGVLVSAIDTAGNYIKF